MPLLPAVRTAAWIFASSIFAASVSPRVAPGQCAGCAASTDCAAVQAEAHIPCGPPAPRLTRAQARAVKAHTRSLLATSAEVDDAVAVLRDKQAAKLAAATRPMVPFKDPYGDPMYSYYGPRAYVQSASYNGPRLASSFERTAVLKYEYRGDLTYPRQVYSVPQMTYRTDTALGVGASQSYAQAGMIYAPANAGPSVYRASELNHH